MAEEKQLLSCVFFVRLDFSYTFFHFDIENDDSSPLKMAAQGLENTIKVKLTHVKCGPDIADIAD